MKKTQESRNATYLRVAINEHLKWTDHIETIVCKANSVNAFKNFLRQKLISAFVPLRLQKCAI